MNIRSLISRYTPEVIKKTIRSSISKREIKSMESLKRILCNTSNLRKNDICLDKIFNSAIIEQRWNNTENEIMSFNLPDGTGGVNPGDRRALFYLLSFLKPQSVLEIGTHIGASTIHIALALKSNKLSPSNEDKLITLDIRDVNSNLEKHWLEYGASHSPLEMVENLGMKDFVDFKTKGALKFMRETKRKFDFIFLDGSHYASDVYQEIPASLNLLNPNGIILLHDYFPSGQPLWQNKRAISGPFRAVEKLKNEGADLITIPLGSLPWNTKLNSNLTSLALLLKK